MSLKPLNDRVIVEAIEKETLSAGGIVLPDTAQEEPQQGIVIAVGPGLRDTEGNRIPLDVAVGDEIIFSRYGGSTLIHDGKTLLILREEEIFAVIENQEN
jgi:chaperonin GroES